ncbi:MAG: hypothetical protein ACON3Z_06665, partial [Bradymonadia bacterium]
GFDGGGPCAACPPCDDGLQNGDEPGVDCGGGCAACPTCDDGMQNGNETGVDCGGACAACVEVDGFRAFVTSTTYPADMGGPIGADRHCQDRAEAAGLDGVYKAFVTVRSGGPVRWFDRGIGPFVRTDGELLADNWDDLRQSWLILDDRPDGSRPGIDRPLNMDEFGVEVADRLEQVWSGGRGTTIANEGVDGGDLHCSDWTSNMGSAYLGYVGGVPFGQAPNPRAPFYHWFGGSTQDGATCGAQERRLYCFEQACDQFPCPEPTHDDGIENNFESDVDCGGLLGTSPRCEAGRRCDRDGDCVSGACMDGVCAGEVATCDDGVQNGDETDVDCGGSCGDCVVGRNCAVPNDCLSGICGEDNVCAAVDYAGFGNWAISAGTTQVGSAPMDWADGRLRVVGFARAAPGPTLVYCARPPFWWGADHPAFRPQVGVEYTRNNDGQGASYEYLGACDSRPEPRRHRHLMSDCESPNNPPIAVDVTDHYPIEREAQVTYEGRCYYALTVEQVDYQVADRIIEVEAEDICLPRQACFVP